MDISVTALESALSIRRAIDRLEKRLSAILGDTPERKAAAGRPHRRMSAAARAKIAAAARARWAKQKSHSTKGKKQSGITPAGRRKLSQLMKARWAARRRSSK